MPVYFECSVSASYLFNVGCVMFTSQRVILPRIGITMQVNVEACPYLHYQIRRSKSTRSNTVWPSGGSAQWQIFIGGANRRSIHGGKAAWAGNSIAKEGPFNSGNTFETIVSLYNNWHKGILIYFLSGILSEIKGLLLDRGRGR